MGSAFQVETDATASLELTINQFGIGGVTGLLPTVAVRSIAAVVSAGGGTPIP
jgi:hypothetical protein